jgi:hypothetical protein
MNINLTSNKRGFFYPGEKLQGLMIFLSLTLRSTIDPKISFQELSSLIWTARKRSMVMMDIDISLVSDSSIDLIFQVST